MDLSIVIVNWNTRDLLLKCLASVYETIRDLCFEIWVVDNASTDGSITAAEERFPKIKVIRNSKNLGFAVANNQALSRMEGRYALLVNTDVMVTESAVQELFYFMESTAKAGMACGQLLNLDGTKQNSMANFPSPASILINETLLRILFPKTFPSKLHHYESPIEVESCIGACLMVRKEAMDAVGLLDERFFFFLEETDWAFRMRRAGWKIFFVPNVRIFHAQGQSVGHEAPSRLLFYRARYQYLQKWFPKGYPLLVALVVARLLVNTCLIGIAVLVTAFCMTRPRQKLYIYLRILLWHLRGCPAPEDGKLTRE